jgi:hypothetical protein
MANYILKISGSNEVINMIEWNGSGSLIAPDGYTFELLSNSSSFTSSIFTSSQSNFEFYDGRLSGTFSGEIVGSVLINGKTLNEIIHESNYGELILINNADVGIISQSNSFFVTQSNIKLPLLNVDQYKQNTYYTTLNKIVDENISNYIISFKQKENPNLKIQYLATNTEITSSGTSSYFNITTMPLDSSSYNTLSYEEFLKDYDLYYRNWYVDFDLGYGYGVGKFYGEFTGDINSDSATFNDLDVSGSINLSGSLLLNGNKIEKVISNTTPYGILQYKYAEPDTSSIYGWDRYAGPYQFTFDSGNFWTSSKTTRVQMNFYNWPTEFDPDYPTVHPYNNNNVHDNFISYLSKMVEIIGSNQVDTNIVFTSIKYPDTKKVFKIKDVKYYVPTLTSSNTADANSNWFLDQYQLIWDMGDVITEFSNARIRTETVMGIPGIAVSPKEKYTNIIDGETGNVIIQDVKDLITNSYYQFSVNTVDPIYNADNVKQRTNFLLSQYDLEVEEIFSSTGSLDPAFFPSPQTIPMDGELFGINFEWTPTTKRKKIEFVTGSKDIIVPDWVEKITLACVGAGGGGGGGASGYAHTGSAPFLDIDNTFRDVFIENSITGTEGNYTPRQDTYFGHEFVTGGGGGAGGCVAIETITGNDAKNARGKSLSLTIGLGGDGGSGSSYFDDVVALNEANSTVIDESLPEYRAWKVWLEVFNGPIGFNSFPGTSFKQGAVGIISPFGELYNGKSGTDTIAVLDNKIVTRAQGGNGGTAGFALKSYFAPYHRLTENGVTRPTAFAFVPGGANDGTTNVGSEIRIGGAGGYGMSMPSAVKQPNITGNTTKKYPKIDDFSYKAANAPNFVWGEFDSSETNVSAWVLPYGNTNRYVTSGTEYLKYKKTGYNITDTSVPLGGGGGVGASYEGIDQRDISVYSSDLQNYGFNKWYGKDYTIPNDYFKKTSNLISSSIRIGLGGNTLEEKDSIIDITDDFGVNHKWEFSIGRSGGHGGYGSYGLWVDDANQSPWSYDGNPLKNLLPQSGSDFPISYPNAPSYLAQAATGGGGGAGGYVLNYEDKYRIDDEELYPTRGQNGARGGNGFAIVVFE